MENYDIISMISQLETPTNTVHSNERYNFKNINMNNYNYRNSNAFDNNFINQLKNDNNIINNNNHYEKLQETEIFDYSKPAKKNAFDCNQMIDNHNLVDNLNTPKNHEKIKYSTIQQKKKTMQLNNITDDEKFGEDYVCFFYFINNFFN
jgi:hypothetical protein